MVVTDVNTAGPRTGIPAWVSDYVGLPWRGKGRDREGLDCYGILRLVLAERFAVALPSHDGVGFETGGDCTDLAAFLEAEAKAWRPLALDEAPRAGDGVLLRVRGHPIHVGVVVAPGWMLHIEHGIDSVVERYDGPRWAKRVIAIYRHEALDDRG